MEYLSVDSCERNSRCPILLAISYLLDLLGIIVDKIFLLGITIEKGGLWFLFRCKYIHSIKSKSIDIWLLVLPSSSAKEDSSNLVALTVECGKHVPIVDLSIAIRLPAARNLCDLKGDVLVRKTFLCFIHKPGHVRRWEESL